MKKLHGLAFEETQRSHILLFDATCPMCWNAIDKVIHWDKKGIFFCAPLDSAIAKKICKENSRLKALDSLILIENYHVHNSRIWVRGRAVMRIFWLLGGFWKWIGWMAYLPFGLDFVYRIVARHRHHLMRK